MAHDEVVEVRVSAGEETCRRFLAALAEIGTVEGLRGPYPNHRGSGVRYYLHVRTAGYGANKAAVERDWLLAEAPDELRARFAAIKDAERSAE